MTLLRPSLLSAANRLALVVALTVSGFCIVALVADPLHVSEPAQPFAEGISALDAVLQFPGRAVVRVLVRFVDMQRPVDWFLGMVFSALLYFAAVSALVRLWARFTQPCAETMAKLVPNVDEVRPTRRQFLARGTQLCGTGTALALGYGVAIEPHRYDITRRRIAIRDLPRSLDRLRIVQLTDLHHGPWLSRDFLREVIDASNRLQPDLCLLTGDYIHQAAEYARPVVQELRRLRPRIGTVAVLGNHDWWEDVERVRAELTAAEIPILDNARRVLTPDRRLVANDDAGLALAGVGDLWEDVPDYAAALDGLSEHLPRLLLSHNPDVAEDRRLTQNYRVDLMLSGHTHGGQIRFPFLGAPIIPSRYGQKYAKGLVHGPAFPVFVCRGIGTSMLPIRFGVPPEIALLELRRADA